MQSSHSFSPSITPAPSSALSEQSSGCAPFEVEWVSIRKSELIQLKADCNSYKSLHQKGQIKITGLEAELELANAKIKDLQQRLFGKKTEKSTTRPSEATPAAGSKRPHDKRRPHRDRRRDPLGRSERALLLTMRQATPAHRRNRPLSRVQRS